MVIKKIRSDKGRSAKATTAYIADAAKAGQGQDFGPKVESFGMLNTVAQDWHGATAELEALAGSYKSEGNTTAHWIISLKEGEKFTADQTREAVKIFLKHQGMEDHLCM